MKKTSDIALIALCLSCLLISCTKNKPRQADRAVQIITESYYVYEPNPIYLDEAKEINELFRYSLINRNKLNSNEQRNIFSKAAALYGENDEAGSALEDAVDESRIMIRKSISMSIAAMVSEPKEALKYFERAKESLNEGGRTNEFMEDDYSAILVLEALYLSEHKLLNDKNKEAMINTISGFSHLSRKSKEDFIDVIKEF
jgi:hypothetical protein